jgi:CubicO group peptidase (beta-lactamase class C family)
VVVKDGAVLLQKGYGYSDMAKRTSVDADNTLFRPGSISKLFAWTAVMQLVEQGKLNLDSDINQYLDFKIRERDGRGITLRNLMTHTPGFEEKYRDLLSDSVHMPLGDYLKSWVPSRIYAAGKVPAYSNYGAALAGYIVQRVSGQSFEDYVEQHIFQPLGMSHSTFRQPLPANLQPLMSRGYRPGLGAPYPFEIFPGPAGGLSASGADLAKFMIAHLQNGTYNGVRILEPQTAIMMHTTALTIAPAVNRMVLGFYESNRNGHRVIGHAGDTEVFHSRLFLFLDDNVGLFVSLNSQGRGGATTAIRTALFEGFTDRYFPDESPAATAATAATTVDAKTAAEHARMMAGRYQPTLR